MREPARIFLVGVALWMLCGIAFAQGERGAITGTILDPSGAVIPDVEIRATEVTTGVVYAARASTAGYYRINALPPGTYRVGATKRGFKTGVMENVVVDVAQVVTGDFTLQVGSLTESVTVTSEAPVLSPDSPEVGSSMTPTELETLPISIGGGGRDLQTFIFTSLPGAVGDGYAGSINGGQLFSHEILIDGISVARPDLNGGSLAGFTPALDAIGEFKVQTANYSAEYGSSASAIANFSIKSGTNEFHGTAYEYLRNPILNAAGFNANAFGTPKGSKKENNFGTAVGGPIRKNRSFFFFTYEGDRFRDFTPGSLITMPTAAMKQGDFSAWLGDQIGTDALGRPVFENEIYDPTTTRAVTGGQIDPVTGLQATQTATIRDPFAAGGQLNAIPQSEFGKGSSVLVPLFPNAINSNLVRNYPSYSSCQLTLSVDRYTGKVDHVFNPDHKIFGSFTLVRNNLLDCDGTLFPPFPGYPLDPIKGTINGGPQARFAYDWTINAHTLNHFAMGYNRFNQTNDYAPKDAGYVSKMGINGLDDRCFPEFGFRGHVGQLGRFAPSCVHTNPRESYLWDDTLSYLHGKHSLKFGGEFRRYRYNTGDIGSAAGSWNFSDRETSLPGFTSETGHPFASFLLGAVDSGGRDFNVTFPGYRLVQLSFFLQDDWKVTPKLTLNLGLRWDLPFPEKEAFSRMSSFDPSLPNPGADNIPRGACLPGPL